MVKVLKNEFENDPALRRQKSKTKIEEKLRQRDDHKWLVKELRIFISDIRDLDFQYDSREKIPEKWSSRPSYLRETVSFFDPHNGPKTDERKRGKKPVKSCLLPLFQVMRDHHFPHLSSMKKAPLNLNVLNLRPRDDASCLEKAELVAKIAKPAMSLTKDERSDREFYSTDFSGSKPSTQQFQVTESKPLISGPSTLIPSFVEEEKPIDVTLEMDDESIKNMNESTLVSYITELIDINPTTDMDIGIPCESDDGQLIRYLT